jgi:hypothetical protein
MGTIFGNWGLSGVVTIQSGPALTVVYTNAANVFGIVRDRAQVVSGCRSGDFVTKGNEETKLTSYFNRACFTTPPVIGQDGIGTGFGNSSTGIVSGPEQENFDVSLSKNLLLRERVSLEIRAEFFNVLNHPQFANPDSNLSSSTFGAIINTAVNPRVGQLALKVSF